MPTFISFSILPPAQPLLLGSDSASSRAYTIFRKGPALALLFQASSRDSSNQTPYPSLLTGRRGNMKSQQARRFFMLL